MHTLKQKHLCVNTAEEIMRLKYRRVNADEGYL